MKTVKTTAVCTPIAYLIPCALTLTSNAALPQCLVDALLQETTVMGLLEVEGNNEACRCESTEEMIVYECP